MEGSKIIKVKVYRFDPQVDKEPHFDTFEVEIKDGYSIYNVLQFINQNLDPSLAFYASCRIGQCHGCLVRANGKVVHACNTMVEDDIVLEPAIEKRVLRDLTMRCADKPE